MMYCNLITIATGIYGLTIFLRLYSIGYDLGKQMAISDKSGLPVSTEILLNLSSQFVIASGIFAVCLLFFFFVANVRKGLVFVSENAKLLMVYGFVISCMGIISFVANKLSTISDSMLTSGLLVLVGFCFIFISFIFKIGITLKEEQELTI